MKTIIVNKGKKFYTNESIESVVAEIMDKEAPQNVSIQVGNDFSGDYREIIEYDNDETSVYWHICDTHYNEDGTLYSVDLDC